MEERREHPIRRDFNQAFRTPDGNVSPAKIVAFAGQVALLYRLGADFDRLVDHWDALALVGGFVIMPDIIKSVLRAKFGVQTNESARKT